MYRYCCITRYYIIVKISSVVKFSRCIPSAISAVIKQLERNVMDL